MLRDKKIALFIDVDNSLLDSEGYESVVSQISAMGDIVCGTIYGASERKHKKVIEQATEKGYLVQQPMRIRRRVRKVFDDRIFVDVTELVQRNTEVDTVAIVSGATDLVYLFAYLRRRGLQVIAADNLDEVSSALAAATVRLATAKAKTVKAPVKKVAPKAVPVVEEKTATKIVDADTAKMQELFSAINKLRADYDAEKAPAKVEEPTPVVEPVVEEVAPVHEEPAPVEEPVVEVEELKAEAPRASYVSQNDSELVKRIEQLRKNSSDDSSDMVAELKKLLDGLE